MDTWEQVIGVLPLPLRERLRGIAPSFREQIQEIRLRKGGPVTLSVRGRQWYLSPEGSLCRDGGQALICSGEWMGKTFDTACEHSVYTHQEELRCGYITTRNGCRIGVGGTAVTQDGEIRSFRNITSLCLRVPRQHRGCAAPMADILCRDGGVSSALVCGEPSSGKTSLLKDLLHDLSGRQLSVAVVDERGELTENGVFTAADILLHTPKAEGVELAVRVLAPQVILFDELGNEQEIKSVMAGLYRGVPAVTSVHCRAPEELLKRDSLRAALEQGAFEYLFFLKGRAQPGQIRQWYKTEEWLREMDGNAPVAADRHGNGRGGVDAVTAAG